MRGKTSVAEEKGEERVCGKEGRIKRKKKKKKKKGRENYVGEERKWEKLNEINK